MYRELDIQVVYHGASVSRLEPWRLVGCLTLAVAAAWLYVTWFPVRHFLSVSHQFNEFGLLDASQVSQLLGFKPPPPELANPAQPNSTPADEAIPELEDTEAVMAYRSDAEASETPPSVAERAQAQAFLRRLTLAMYTWLTTMTVVGCWLAMTGAAAVSGWLAKPGRILPGRLFALLMLVGAGVLTWKYWPRAGEELPRIPRAFQYAYAAAFALLAWALCASWSRSGAAWLLVVGLVALLLCGGVLWSSYQWGWPVRAAQTFWFGLMVVAALAGATLSSHRRGLTSIGIALVLLSCLVTALGMWYGQRSGGFVTYTPTVKHYVMAMVAQSGVAWVLMAARAALR